MEKFINQASWDRILRVVIGVIMLVVGWGGMVTGVWGEVFKFLGFVPLLTGLAGFCPIYALLKLRTKKASVK